MLRSPVNRYLSEWRHVSRGNEWTSARLSCDGRQASLAEVPFCFSGDAAASRVLTDKDGVFDRERGDLKESWRGVNLDDFLSCEANLASDRQTRMLANLSLVSCYDRTALPPARRQALLLRSAKRNLRRLAYFGLVERQRASQTLFEATFGGARFRVQFALNEETHAASAAASSAQVRRVRRRNSLDGKLYAFAVRLFDARLARARQLVNSDDPS